MLVDLVSNAATYTLAVLPLVVFFTWTRMGNWYTYDVGWMMMTLDIGIWLIDIPAAVHHLVHFNTATVGWKWYYACAAWVVISMMAWRGLKIYRTLRSGRRDL